MITFPGSIGTVFNMDVHKWTVYVLVSLVIVLAKDQCPIKCSSENCYLIYPENGRWKYMDPDGNVHDGENNVYPSPNCYKYIETSSAGSCYVAQRRCEDVGSNITAINNRKEYDQLTSNVVHILKYKANSRFIVHVLQSLPRLRVVKGCATINVNDGFLSNPKKIENIQCSATIMTNIILCESTDLNAEICPVATTEINPPSTFVTSTRSPISMVTTSTSTNWSTQDPTSQTSEENQTEPQSRSSHVHVTSSVVAIVIIIVIILSFVLIRRIKRRNSLKDSQNRVKFSNGGGVHENSTDEQDSGDVYNLLYATNSLSVASDAYDIPNQDNPAKDVTNSEEYDLMNGQSVYSNQDNADLYALPNKNKEHSSQDLEKGRDIQPKTGLKHTEQTGAFNDDTLYENTKGAIQDDERKVTYDCVNAEDSNAGKDMYAVPNKNKEFKNQEKVCDINQRTERQTDHIGAFDDGALYENAKGNTTGDEREVYECLNAADMQSEYECYNEPTVGFNGVQSSISGAGIQTDKENVGTENEYGKLKKNDEQYSYVDTEINHGLVLNPCIGNHTYDKLQRN